MKISMPILRCFLALLLLSAKSFAQTVDLSKAQIYCPVNDKKTMLRSLEVLQEEVQKRTGIKLAVAKKLPAAGKPVIAIALESDISKLPQKFRTALNTLPDAQKEGFKLLINKEDNSALIVGKDARGILYGIGRFLRKSEMRKGQLVIATEASISTSPKYPIRGHQLGYRPKTNAYDAFSVAMFDQYIRDIALFGANSIEIVPPRTDDDAVSRHMKLPPQKMIIEQSRIAKEYGMDVWMWYPNMASDYTHADTIKKELKEREEIFSKLPRLDHVFVPGGDPGDLEPDVLFAFMAKEAAVLQKYHPKAKMWVSPQVFRPTQKWFDAFFGHVNKEYPWFGGVVFGPWIKIPVQEIRRLVKPSIPIRNYPDITHNYSSQYPVPQWDLPFAMTLGRESITPRPYDEKLIHNALDEYADGSISYSEGTNDDVNKFVWSDQDWDPEMPVIETLRDYSRLFIGPDFTEGVAQGLIGLERNIKGPLLVNDGIERTLQQWQKMEKDAPLKVLQTARFQMGLIRAYFDAYIHRRMIYENELEKQAKEKLTDIESGFSLTAIKEAREILEQAWKKPILPAYKKKCYDLADSLYKSIGAQLTMDKHGAMSGRGNFVDLIDMPLNDAPWLLDQLEKIEAISSDQERLTKIHEMLHRTDPGPGGFYDHFGSPESWYRVVQKKTWEEDPGSLQSARIGFGVGLVGEEWVDEIKATGFKGQVTPRVWMKQAKTLYNEPLEIVYNDLDPKAVYKMRVSYTGRFRSWMKLTTDDGHVVHELIKTGDKPIYEFDLPHSVTADGKVKFIWNCGEGERGSQVTEIWLIPVK
jgi:hypothetical protein